MGTQEQLSGPVNRTSELNEAKRGYLAYGKQRWAARRNECDAVEAGFTCNSGSKSQGNRDCMSRHAARFGRAVRDENIFEDVARGAIITLCCYNAFSLAISQAEMPGTDRETVAAERHRTLFMDHYERNADSPRGHLCP